MALPPFDEGADHETTAEPLPGTALTPVGALAAVTGVTAFDCVDDALDPTALIATTVKV
jgi:hypothetical protein